jgi:outer membrane lipoprotein-sorting protein
MFANKRFLAIFLAILILAGSAVTLAALTIPTAQALLTAAVEQAQTAREGHLVAEVEFNAPQQNGRATAEAWFKLEAGPNGEPAFRLTILEASEAEMVGLTAVSDGSQFWLYNPAANKVIVGEWAQLKEAMNERGHRQADDFDWDEWEQAFPRDFNFDPAAFTMPETTEEAVAQLLQYFTVNRAGSVEIGDSRAYVIRLVPIAEQMPDEVRAAGGYLNVWIRVSDNAPLGLEYVQGVPGGFRLAATTLELNQGVDESQFTFAIPDGAEIVPFDEIEPPAHAAAGAADVAPLTPAELPDGAELVETAVIRGASVARYQLDGAEFYIAQGPSQAAANLFGGEAGETVTARGQEANLYLEDDGGRLLLTWSENGLSFWIGGQLTAEQALALAESLR